VGVFVVPGVLQAAELWLTTSPPIESGVGEVTVRLSTAGVAANVVSGTLTLPEDSAPPIIATEPSVVSYWIVPPTITPEGTLIFAGMTPGGFIAQDEPIFSFRTSAFATGFGVASATLLAHDGVGTPLPVTIRPTEIVPAAPVTIDTEPPQLTLFEIVENPALFAGAPTLIFTASDAETGAVRAEIQIGEDGVFEPITSPFLLPPAAYEEQTVLRITDGAGNAREYTLPLPEARAFLRDNQMLLSLAIVCIVTLLLVSMLFWWWKYRQGVTQWRRLSRG
jgi:hypothetical protein